MKALITGASSGIGKEMALYLAEKGWSLILVGRNRDTLRKVRAACGGVHVKLVVADLSHRKDCFALYREVANDQIDLVCCNAGFGQFGNFHETPLERDLAMIGTNITAVHILTKLFVRDFVRRGHGHILLTASAAGFLPGPRMATYYATKHYVRCLGESVYEELRRLHSPVKISVLCPGPVDTAFSQQASVGFLLPGQSSRAVARRAIDGALRGKMLIIPSLPLQLLLPLRRLAGEKTLARIAYHMQRPQNQQQPNPTRKD